jgi:hypothetical protein
MIKPEEYTMQKRTGVLIICCLASFNLFCSSNGVLDVNKPHLGESVRITQVDGSEQEGVIIAKQGAEIKYVDAKTHSLEIVQADRIRSLARSANIYDLEGNTIGEQEIDDTKKSGKTIGYSLAGTALGAAVGFGIGVILAGNSDVPIGYPMLICGVAGGITMGFMGHQADVDDAIGKIRQDRLANTQNELREQLLKEQQLLDEERKEKEKMIKDMEKK